jgi:hypothetical protein
MKNRKNINNEKLYNIFNKLDGTNFINRLI